jgi:hypothetical protein
MHTFRILIFRVVSLVYLKPSNLPTRETRTLWEPEISQLLLLRGESVFIFEE